MGKIRESSSSVGKLNEDKATEFLREKGCIIVERNFRCKFGEIDIIAKDGDTLAFIEVKYKTTKSAGYAEEAVTIGKIHKICRTSDYYRLKSGISENIAMRYDVVAINDTEIKWYRNAFEYQ